MKIHGLPALSLRSTVPEIHKTIVKTMVLWISDSSDIVYKPFIQQMKYTVDLELMVAPV